MHEFKVGDTAFVVQKGRRPYIDKCTIKGIDMRDGYNAITVWFSYNDTEVKYVSETDTELYSTKHNALPELISAYKYERKSAIDDVIWYQTQITECELERDGKLVKP